MTLARTLVLASLLGAGCATDPDAEPDLAPPAPPPPTIISCGSIHAVQIAQNESLANCTTAVIGAVPLSTRGLGCAGLTANACAQEHYDHAESYVNAAGTGAFELHYLPAADQLSCADGTRPHYYFHPGADASKWIVYQNGGSGKCGRTVTRAGAYSDAGYDCFALFASGDGNTGFHRDQWWKGEGIMYGGAANVDFRDWNRVWIPSCSNDQYQGSADHPAEGVLTKGLTRWQAPLYSHGFDIVLAVIDDLAGGAVDMDLSDASLVMLYGTSGGAGGLQMTLDAKAEHVGDVSSARVVGLLDSRSEPNIAGGEGLFDGFSCGSIFKKDCPVWFSQPPAGTDLGAGFAFDTTAYQPDTACVGCGTARYKTEWWGNNLDASCALRHAADLTPCYDGYHVMYEDTVTPVFHATSLRDHNQYNGSIEYVTVAAGDAVTFQSLEVAPNCGDLPRERVIGQLDAYATYRDAVGGGAHGESHDAGPIGIWAIDWADHEITKSSCIFNDAELDGVTLSRAILDWAVDQTPVVLIDAPGMAVRTVNPTCAEQVNTCP